MKNISGLVLALLIAAPYRAQEVPLYFGQTSRLDRIFALTREHSQTGATALELLELVALGRTSSIRAGTETLVGLMPSELHQPAYDQASVRVYALLKIGECALPEALEFLKNLKRADLGEDTTQMIWPNARVALSNALVSRITDPHARIEFLVKTLSGEGDGRSLVAFWAVNLLCDQGTSTALPLIRRSFKSSWSGERGEEAIAFCETRMEVVSRDPDRVKALRSVLTVDGAVSDELLRWAVYQLGSIHSPDADAELNRFAKELGKLREGSPEYARFWALREDLRRIREKRAK
jgi:hypothetical protein